MGATYTRQSSYTDGDVITAADTNNEFDQLLAAFAASTGHTHDGTTAEGGPITKLLGTSITIGDATAGTDITVTFDGESNDGVLKWMEDEDYFEFSDDILVASTEKIQFRDTAIYINSSADGQLDLVADTEIQIAATTVDINGAVDVSGNLSVGGNLDVTGTFDLSDSNFTNAGNIQLDSISGDSDTNTSITFSGSDVITVATGGTTSFTVDASQNILMSAAKKVQFRDTALTINSSTDGQMDIDADTELEITAPTVDINASTAVLVSNDLKLDSDAAVLGFGADNDVTLTHVADTGLLLNGTMALQFNDASQSINAPSATVLDINATDEIELNATLVDANANLDVSGTYTGGGLMTTGGNIVIPDSGNIGSASDTDAIAIASNGQVTLTQTLIGTALDISGDIDVDGTTNLDVVDIDGAVDMATTLAVAGNVDFNGDLDVDGTTNLDNTDIDGTLVVDGSNISLDSTSTLNIDNSNTSNGITIGTATSGVPVSIGHTTSETTVNDNLTVTGSTTLAATSFGDADITNVGDIALDSISADGTDINIAVTDNSATALTIKQGSDAYLIVDTANSSESVSIGTGISGTAITIGHGTSETTIGDNLVVTGNLTVNGTTTTVNSTTMTVDDPIITLGGDTAPGSDDNKDRGIEFRYHDGSSARIGFFGYDDSASAFTFLTAATNSSEVFSGTIGNVTGGVGTFASLDISGNIDVDGTTNLDVVDIDGAVDMASTLTVGGVVDITDTTDSSDATGDTGALRTEGGASIAKKLYVGTDLDVDGTANLDVVDIDGAVDMASTLQVSGLITASANITMAGTTPTLTIGDGGEEDAKILFNGNEQNFHIGIDDSTNKLTIGLGNNLGTYPGFTMDENTAVEFPDNTLTIISSGNHDMLTLKSTDADANVGPVLNFTRDSSSPANNDFLGELTFQGDNNAGEAHDYIRMFARILNVADGSEQADFIMKDATGNNIVNFAHSEVVYNDDSVDRDFRVESNGNANMLHVDGGSNLVGIGADPDLGAGLHIKTADTGASVDVNADELVIEGTRSGLSILSANNDFGYILFGDDGQNNIGSIRYGHSANDLRITVGGSESMVIASTGQTTHTASINDVLLYLKNTETSGNVFGQQINFSSTANDTGSYFFRCLGNNNSTVRAAIYSNGDFDSATNSYGATSDERIKQNITDANSQWDDIKGLRVRNFKFKDEARTEANGGQTAKTYLGLVAQEAETVSPGLIKEKNPEKADILSSSEFGTLYTADDSETQGDNPTAQIGDVKEVTEQVKSVSYSVLYMKAIKALQEAMTRIETLETKVAALEE